MNRGLGFSREGEDMTEFLVEDQRKGASGKSAGNVGSWLLVAAVGVIVASIIMPRYWSSIPSWGKAVAVLAGVLVLCLGWWLDRITAWPSLNRPDVPPSRSKEKEQENKGEKKD